MDSVSIGTLREKLEAVVAVELQKPESNHFWGSPIMASAAVDDRFTILPEIAMDEHLLPDELLNTARSVLVFFIPFQKWLVKENREGDRPCRNWGLAYVQTNDLIESASQMLSDSLKQAGYRSELTPATHNFDEAQLMSDWSHKHVAYIAGIGGFAERCDRAVGGWVDSQTHIPRQARSVLVEVERHLVGAGSDAETSKLATMSGEMTRMLCSGRPATIANSVRCAWGAWLVMYSVALPVAASATSRVSLGWRNLWSCSSSAIRPWMSSNC